MDEKTFKNLAVGDLVRHKSSYRTYVVTENFGNRITAVRTVDLTNPEEWDLTYSRKLKGEKDD